MKLLIIGDGPRDEAALPPLVSTILGFPIEAATLTWKDRRLHSLSFERKMRFVITEARSDRMDGAVAVIDADKWAENRRTELNKVCNQLAQSHADVPLAQGMADPHGEAWLLDDPVAVRQALGLDDGHEIPSVKGEENPKARLETLIRDSSRAGDSRRDVLKDIAAAVCLERCSQKHNTGLADFDRTVGKKLGSR